MHKICRIVSIKEKNQLGKFENELESHSFRSFDWCKDLINLVWKYLNNLFCHATSHGKECPSKVHLPYPYPPVLCLEREDHLSHLLVSYVASFCLWFSKIMAFHCTPKGCDSWSLDMQHEREREMSALGIYLSQLIHSKSLRESRNSFLFISDLNKRHKKWFACKTYHHLCGHYLLLVGS